MNLTDGTANVAAGRPRIRSLDVLKGAAILGVIIAHIAVVEDRINFDGNRLIGELFYSALPMFIVVSGYFHRTGRTFAENIRRRVVPIFVAFVTGTVVLTVIMYFYLEFLGYGLSFGTLWSDILNILIGKGAFSDLSGDVSAVSGILNPYEVTLQMYYLQMLVIGYTIFYIMVDSIIDDGRKVLISIVLLVTVTALYMEFIHIQLPFYAQLGPMVAAFLLIGAFLGKHRVVERVEAGPRRTFWQLFIALGVLAFVMIKLFPTNMALIYSQFGDYGGWSAYTFMLTSVSCGAFLYFVAELASRIPVFSGFMDTAGKDSYTLFILHIFVAKLLISPFATIGVDRWFPVDYVWQGIILAVATITVIMGATYLAYRLWDIRPKQA